MDNTELILEIKGLRTFFYKGKGIIKAVNNVSFNIKKGEILGIAGESGSGKTILALSILRLIPYPGKIVSGKIIYKGEDLMQKSSTEMENIRGAEIGMIFQDPMSCLNPVFNIGEQICSGIMAHKKISKDKCIEEAIQMVRVVQIPDPERIVYGYQHELSGGMKQRVMIAIALSNHPNFLIADNPTTSLDSTIQLQFLNLILELRKRFNMTILYITHDFGIAAKLCDRVAILYAGEIIEIGSVFNVLKRPKHPYSKKLIEAYQTLEHHNEIIKAMKGKAPDLGQLPPGCKFGPRCDFLMAECPTKNIDFFETEKNEDSHLVRCLLYK